MSEGAKSPAFWRFVIPLLLCFFAFQLYHLFRANGGDLSALTYPDEINYYVGGAERIRTEGFGYFLTPRSLWNAPLYPLWIAVLGISVPLVKILNLLMICTAGALVADASRRIWGRWGGVAAVVGYLLYYPLFVFGGTVLSEPPFIFAMVVAFWCWVIGEGRSFWWGCAAGAALGVGALIRPTIQLFPFLLLVGVVGSALCSRGRGSGLVRAALGCFLGAAVLILPYVAKNVVLFGRPTIANGFGAVLYLGSDLRKDGNEPVYSRMDFDTYEKTAPYTHLDSEGDSILIREALKNLTTFPYDSSLLFIRKAVRFLVGDFRGYFYPFDDLISYYRHSGSWVTARTLFELSLRAGVVSFALVALLCGAIPVSVRIYSFSFLVYFVGIHALSFPIPRLSLPLYPVLCVVAGGYAVRSGHLARFIAFGASILVAAILCLYGRYWDFQVISDRFTHFFSPMVKINLAEGRAIDGVVTDGGWLVSKGRQTGAAFHYEVPPFEGKVNQVVFLEIEARANGKGAARRWEQGVLAWRGEGEDFSPEREAGFPIRFHGEKQIYMVSPGLMESWRRPIRELRLRFPTGRRAERYRVTRVEVAR